MQGEEFILGGGERVIGRAAESDIAIPDTSVSRRHVLVRKVAADWTVQDLGSGNGTLVNGESVEEEQVLLDGDVITLGDTELTFVEGAPSAGAGLARRDDPAADLASRPVAPRPPRARPQRRGARGAPAADPPWRQKRFAIAGAVVGLLLLGLVGARWKVTRAEAEATRRAEAEAAAIRQFGALFQEGKNLVRAGKWREALVKFEALKAQAPGYPSLSGYLDRAAKEIPNQTALDTAEAALAKSSIAEASQALATVTADTQLYERQGAVASRLEEKIQARVKEAQGVVESAPRDAKAIVDDVLVAVPTNRDALAIQDRAARAIELAERPAAVAPGPQAPRPGDPAVARFADGDLTGAVALARACGKSSPRCRELASAMEEFARLYKRLESLDAAGLGKLLALDRKITGGRASRMAQTAATRAGTVYYKSASSARAAGQWARAMTYARKALEADPSHVGAQGMLGELKGQAKDQYLRAYSLKDQQPDEAIAIFRDVVNMTAPGDEVHDKAQKWLEKLTR